MPHPGEIIREDYLKLPGLSVTAAAEWLGVSRQSLSELLNGCNGISAEITIRLEMDGGVPRKPGWVFGFSTIDGSHANGLGLSW